MERLELDRTEDESLRLDRTEWIGARFGQDRLELDCTGQHITGVKSLGKTGREWKREEETLMGMNILG